MGADHAGYEAKEAIKAHLIEAGYEVTDCGAHEYDAQDDYPAFCIAAAEAVAKDPGSLGFVLGGSGNGEQMAANTVEGIRAALVWNQDTAKLAREHNDAQVMALGGRQHEFEEALGLALTFLAEPFSGDERHVRRIAQLGEYERTGDIAGKLSAVTTRPFTAN